MSQHGPPTCAVHRTATPAASHPGCAGSLSSLQNYHFHLLRGRRVNSSCGNLKTTLPSDTDDVSLWDANQCITQCTVAHDPGNLARPVPLVLANARAAGACRFESATPRAPASCPCPRAMRPV